MENYYHQVLYNSQDTTSAPIGQNCYRGQVSKETLVLRRWESIAGNLVNN